MAILISILLMLGAAQLAKFIIKVVLLKLKDLLTNIRAKLKEKQGTTVFVAEIGKLVNELKKEAEKAGNVHKIDDLIDQLDGDGVIMTEYDENGKLANEDDLKIIKAEQMDDGVTQLLARNNGELLLTA